VGWDAALDDVAERFAGIVAAHGPDAVGLYLSGQLLTEDYYVFNKLAKGLIGTNNVDTNSRLCMSSAVAGYKASWAPTRRPPATTTSPGATVFIAGSNMAWAHPVLFRRLETRGAPTRR
jgi:assimilatory nitrate reductase catalytic subunit